jgi:hypothetical protein
MENIKSVMDRHCKHLTFDKSMLTRVQAYQMQFANKNEAHITFFGGNLMGVEAVRFKPEDRNKWFEEVLEVDETALEDDLHALPEVVTHRHVSSDVMNLSCVWVIHKFLTSDKLNDDQKYDGAMASALILQYKFITSIMTNMFHWSADPIIAQATYAALSKRFGLKVAGTWGELLRQRADDIVRKGGLHYQRLVKFDKDIDYIVNDIQGRIKSFLNNIRDVFEIVRHSPEMQIRNFGSTIELDGEIKIRDTTRMVTQYRNYLLEILPDRNAFIINELVGVIAKTVPQMTNDLLTKVLTYFANNASVKADPRVQRICDLVLQHAFNHLATNPDTMLSKSDLPGLIRKMRNLYQASRTTNPMILEMRELTEAIAKVATGSKNKVLIPAIRNAALLYILVRAFTYNHYRK